MHDEAAGQPAVGNVLGFSLVLREHRVLLRLDRRTLAPGVHLLEYEAQVPGVGFPVEGALSAARFRHRRALVQRVALEVDRHTLQAWMSTRLLGREIAGVRIERVELEPQARAGADDAALPWLGLTGRGPGGGFTYLGIGLAVATAGRTIALGPARRWIFASAPIDADEVWQAIARALGARSDRAHELVIDAVGEALRQPFARAGWKLPALERLGVVELAIGEREAVARWSADGANTVGPGRHTPICDLVDRELAGSAAALHAADVDTAFARLEQAHTLLAGHPAAIGLLRWMIELARRMGRSDAAYCRALLRLRPSDPWLRRRVLVHLARSPDELARQIAVWERLAHGESQRLHLAIAAAHAAAARGDGETARAAISPWLAREAELGELATPLLLAWAHVAIDDGDPALAALGRALAGVSSPERRAALRIDMAARLRARDRIDPAWQLLLVAVGDAEIDRAWVEEALALLATGVVPRAARDTLVRAAASTGDPRLHRALADAAEAEGRGLDARVHLLAWADASEHAGDRLAALRRLLASLGGTISGLADVVGAADRAEVVELHRRILADDPGDLDALVVVAHATARAGEDEAAAALDDRVLAHGGDDRIALSLVRMIARAQSDADDAHALELGERLMRMSIPEGALPVELRAVAAEAVLRSAADEPDPARFAALCDRLAARGRRGELVRLLGQRLDGGDTPARIDAAKRLAHLLGEELGDHAGAVAVLERALVLAPDDPEVLLPLLDHRFAGRDLAAAIAATLDVLERMPMGNAAYHALVRRACDSAIAIGDGAAALELIERLLARMPDDGYALARRDELRTTVSDPGQRVRLLASIAARHVGSARLEALEERARLLVDPLDRVDEAISDLAAVIEEAPERAEIAERLAELYQRRRRFTELAELLSRMFPRERGARRCAILRRLAAVLRDELFDLPRAEQAIRLALEVVAEDDDARESAENLRMELIELLEREGRWVDLAYELQRELAGELAGEPPRHPLRIDMLVRLARLQRDVLDDDALAAATYEILLRLGRLPDDGLGPLARAYRKAARHEDLVKVMQLRAEAVRGDPRRWAVLQQHVAELLDGPLANPLAAADHYLEAFLVDPRKYAAAGRRARVLYAGSTIARVRDHIEQRLRSAPTRERTELHALLGDVLSAHVDLANAAELNYRKALEGDAEALAAHEGLGRLALRRGDHEIAAFHLGVAAVHAGADPQHAADLAALAARPLVALGRERDAEALLDRGLRSAPQHARALLELSRILERQNRMTELSVVLENLARLPLPASLHADVLHRRAITSQAAYRMRPHGPEADAAVADALEALRADPNHLGTRQLLLELSRLRDDWSIYVRGLELALRPLGPGGVRARLHLELAESSWTRMRNADAARNHLAAAATELDAEDDERMLELALRLPDPQQTAAELRGVLVSRPMGTSVRARLERVIAAVAGRSSSEPTSKPPPPPPTPTSVAGLVELGAYESALARISGCDEDELVAVDRALARTDPHAAGFPAALLRGVVARALGRPADALAALGIAAGSPDAGTRGRALSELDGVLAIVGQPSDRLPVLRARFEHARASDTADVCDVAAELAQVELAVGEVDAARRSCMAGLALLPDHRELLRTLVDALERGDRPADLRDALVRYAAVCVSPRERARHLVRAARGTIDAVAHLPPSPEQATALATASALLGRAIASDPDEPTARATALPLEFARSCWHDVVELASWWIERERFDEPALVLAALAEALLDGSQRMARAIGARHAAYAGRHLLPGLRQVLTDVAGTGPMQRLDAVLDAAAVLSGGPLSLFDRLTQWAMGRPLQSGLTLGLARLNERHGAPALAAHLWQLTAFLAPRGPWAALLAEHPAPIALDFETSAVMWSHGHAAVRAAARAIAAAELGVPVPIPTAAPEALATIDAIVAPLRERIAAGLTVVIDAGFTRPAVALAERRGRAVLRVNMDAFELPAGELRYRCIHAVIAAATGLGLLLLGDDDELAARLDALAVLANPTHTPTGERARVLANVLLDRHPRVLDLGVDQRMALLDELSYWLSSRERMARLRREFAWTCDLLATRASGELAGALRVIGSEAGALVAGEVDPLATLRTERAQWLLRSLGLYAQVPDKPSDKAHDPSAPRPRGASPSAPTTRDHDA